MLFIPPFSQSSEIFLAYAYLCKEVGITIKSQRISSTGQIMIGAGVVGVVLIMVLAVLWCFIVLCKYIAFPKTWNGKVGSVCHIELTFSRCRISVVCASKYCTVLFNLNLDVMCDAFGPIWMLKQGIKDVWWTKKFEPQLLKSSSIVQLYDKNLKHSTSDIGKGSISNQNFKL